MEDARTVLVVDDDRDWRAAVSALLEDAGYRVETAETGRDGVLLARSLRPDVVILDVMMAERTEGFFVLQELRRDPRLAETPVIVASSIYTEHPNFRVRPDAGWLPASRFLAKPVDPARLLTEVREVLRCAEDAREEGA